MTRVAITRDRDEERAVRFDQILEELRLNTEDMRELAKRAVERARETSRNLKATVEKARAERAVRKVGKKKLQVTARHNIETRRVQRPRRFRRVAVLVGRVAFADLRLASALDFDASRRRTSRTSSSGRQGFVKKRSQPAVSAR